jgi:CHAT domain-containing protein
VGPVLGGEGVIGLRRAFQIAGARTIIMSLWEVNDLPAREWINRLYEARLSGLTTVDSVHRASLATLQARRKAGVGTHPFYWGAFIASGDWR